MNPKSVGCCFSIDGSRKLCWMIHVGCNLRCGHCAVFANDFVAAHRGVKDLADIAAVMDFIDREQIDKVVLSGGEPTLSRWLVPIIERLDSLDLSFSLSTNATTLSPRRVGRLVNAGLHKATVSLDGSTAKLHDDLRGPGAFDRALRGVELLVQAGVVVSVGSFLREDTTTDVGRLGSLCRELGVERLSLFRPVVRGRYLAAVDGPRPSPSTRELLAALRADRAQGLTVTVHAPRCNEADCPSGEEIFGAIGGRAFDYCVYKQEAAPRMLVDMLAA